MYIVILQNLFFFNFLNITVGIVFTMVLQRDFILQIR